MAREEWDLDHTFDFENGCHKTRRTKYSPRNQSAKRAAEIDEEIKTRLRAAFEARRKAKTDS